MSLGLEICRLSKTRTLSSQVGSLGTEHCRAGWCLTLAIRCLEALGMFPFRVSAQLALTHQSQAFSCDLVVVNLNPRSCEFS